MTESKPPVLVMLCGVPTSGKSTYYKQHGFDESDYVLISSDHFIDHAAKLLSMTYDAVFSDHIKWATQQMEYFLDICISYDKNIVCDQTNLTPKTRKQKLKKIPNHYKKIAVYFEISEEESMIRNQKRKGKIIPPNVLLSMHKSFVIPTLEEGFDQIYNASLQTGTLITPKH